LPDQPSLPGWSLVPALRERNLLGRATIQRAQVAVARSQRLQEVVMETRAYCRIVVREFDRFSARGR
jgi:hypothetical protein